MPVDTYIIQYDDFASIENIDPSQKKDIYDQLAYPKQSTLVIEIPYKRAIGASFFRYISPVSFVLLVALLFDYLDDDEAWEVKVIIPPTILLTLIFMHSGLRSEIQQVSYTTFMDQYYSCAYVSVLILLLGSFATYNQRERTLRSNDNFKIPYLHEIIRSSYLLTSVFIPIVILYFDYL